mgnify:CR=1 FL=1
MSIVLNGTSDLFAKANTELGKSEWQTMTFERIQAFADATDDHQWIHVDRERIAKESPFGAPIAHGYLTLSMVAGLFFEVLELKGFAMVINYGTNKVRFPSPLKEGAKFRMSLALGDVTDKGKGWVEGLFHATMEIEDSAKPALSAEIVFRFLQGETA